MLPKYNAQRKSGDERILVEKEPVGPSVLEFWQWSSSDLLTNSLRGLFAEFLVGSALKIASGTRTEWDATDLRLKNGITIEVKSSAYLQSWDQKQHSTISFSVRETNAWSYESNSYSTEKIRQSDIYVFCLLSHTDKLTINPLDTEQWTFFVVATSDINAKCENQKTISLAKLIALPHDECTYTKLDETIREMATRIAG